MEKITISKQEYYRLKELEKLDLELLVQIASSLEDVKKGRIKEC